MQVMLHACVYMISLSKSNTLCGCVVFLSKRVQSTRLVIIIIHVYELYFTDYVSYSEPMNTLLSQEIH